MTNDNYKITECESCHYPDIKCYPTRIYARDLPVDQQQAFYCDVCRSTLISSLSRSAHPSNEVMQTIGYCTNLILDELRKAGR